MTFADTNSANWTMKSGRTLRCYGNSLESEIQISETDLYFFRTKTLFLTS